MHRHVEVFCSAKDVGEYRLDTLLGLLASALAPGVGCLAVGLHLVLMVAHFVAKLPSVDRSRLLDRLLLLLSGRHLLLDLMLVLSLLWHALLAVIGVILFLLFHLEATTLFECRPLSHVASLNLVLDIQVERCYLLFGHGSIAFVGRAVGHPFLQLGRYLELVNEALFVGVVFDGVPVGINVIILQYVLEIGVGTWAGSIAGCVDPF